MSLLPNFLKGLLDRFWNWKKDPVPCPKCFSSGTWKVFRKATDLGHPGVLACTACHYLLYETQAYGPRHIHIASAGGTTAAGQTVWHTMLRHIVGSGFEPQGTGLRVEPAPTYCSGMNGVERQLECMLGGKSFPWATYPVQPEPATYHIRRLLQPGPPRLTHVFDFAGEILNRPDYHRTIHWRLLQMDGIALFLDLECYLSAWKHWPIQQERTVLNFLDDLRMSSRTRPGNRVPMPIAVCVSKLDMLEKLDPLRASEHRRFIRSLQGTGSTVSPEAISRRSDLCRAHMRHLFPAANGFPEINNEMYRITYFPMSPIGFCEMGESDLGKRTIQPFGVIEPIVWLFELALCEQASIGRHTPP